MASVLKIGDVNFEVLFENLPDWAIPMMRIVPVFYTLDAYHLDETTFYYDFNYWWEKIDNINYLLKIRVSARLYNGASQAPLYLNLKAYFLNYNRYETFQHK